MNVSPSRPQASVVIPNWNGKHHLEACLDSLRAQTFRDFEVVLVDGGSTDGSREFLSERYPEVRVVALAQNRGFAGGVNAGIIEARGRYVVLLNNDTRAEPRWLGALVEALERDPGISMAASKMLLWDDGRINSAGDRFDLRLGRGFSIGIWQQDDGRFDEPCLIFGACGGAAAYRRELLDEIGLLDEDFFAVYEDIDLSFRSLLAGYRCLFVPGAIVHHKMGASRAEDPNSLRRRERNRKWVLLKNLPWVYLAPALAQAALEDLRQMIAVRPSRWKGSRERIGVYAGSWLDLARGSSSLWAKRRAIQARRKVGLGYLWTVLRQERMPYAQLSREEMSARGVAGSGGDPACAGGASVKGRDAGEVA